ncbi:ommochrome-binding protein-like [Galleria mellonella]|uniref:Ommochrome-binding protein-like n=1 Tax=Galleria mellonella TaxID=7137 RepID=A0A6J1X8M7_GALME|nr:ommochrome-binding protein-like [Galleria mellonella]
MFGALSRYLHNSIIRKYETTTNTWLQMGILSVEYIQYSVAIMKLVIILCVIIVLVKYNETKKENKRKCEGIHVNGKNHKRVVLSNGINRPYQLSISKPNHTIYFSYNTGFDNTSTFEIGYITKKQKVVRKISAVKNGFATAINEKDNIVYFGGSDGIYMDDISKSGNIQHLIKGHNIWDLFYKDGLYFISYPTLKLYKYMGGNKSEIQKNIHEKIYQFAIDGDEDTFITNKTGLYIIKNGTNERILYEGAKVFRAIEINNKGVAHFCGQNEIYVANKHKHTLHKIADIKDIFGLVFDHEDNIIYSNPHEIVKLLPEECK